MKEKLAKLVDLKSIITVIMVLALVYGFIVDKVSTSEFVPMVSLILAFYFTKKKESE